MMKKGNIALIGFMGTGKSTVGSKMSEMMNMKFVETDKLIEERECMSITEIFNNKGEEYFRKCETEILEECMGMHNTVISCGGGLVLRKLNAEILKRISTVILLTAEPETILQRICRSTTRPVLNGNMNEEYICNLLEKRKAVYTETADIIIRTDNMSIEDVCKKIQSIL